MTRVAILPVPTEAGEVAYHAVSSDKQSLGRTAGEALDALSAQLQDTEGGTLVVVQHHRPDAFFGEAQQRRLGELMDRWRTARDSGVELPQDEQAELDALVAEELQASARRATAILHDVTQ